MNSLSLLRRLGFFFALLIAIPANAAVDAGKAHDIFDKAKPSLVAIKYTWSGELARRELVGAGVVVRDDGLVMCSAALMPSVLPDAQLTDFKIIVPADDTHPQQEVPAIFQGRDDRTGLAFVKASQPQKWTAIHFVDMPIGVGHGVVSIGVLPKPLGYHAYLAEAMVIADVLPGQLPQVLVSPGGLGAMSSPVFDNDGQAIGFVNNVEQPSILNDEQSPLAAIQNPPRTYVPASDFLLSLDEPPSPEHPIVVPWMGISQLTGLSKDVSDYYKLEDQPAVQVGDVIPGFAADKAGVKSGDIIVKMNGKPLRRGDEPDDTAEMLVHDVRRMKPGDNVTFTLLKDKGETRELTLKLDPRPKQTRDAARFYASDLGFVAREIIPEDLYARKLPADTQGVIIALIKPSSAAATAQLSNSDLVTKINQTPVTSLDQFKQQYQSFRKDHPQEGVIVEVLRGVNTEVIRIEPPRTGQASAPTPQ